MFTNRYANRRILRLAILTLVLVTVYFVTIVLSAHAASLSTPPITSLEKLRSNAQMTPAVDPGSQVFLPTLNRNAYTCVDRPVMLWPAEGELVNTLIPLYYWDSCNIPDAIYVHFQLSPNPDMSNWILSLYTFPTGMGLNQEHKNLNSNTTYYWRIRVRYPDDAFGNFVYGPYATGSFRTAATGTLLPPPTLLSPANHSSLAGTTVNWSWQAVGGADKYLLEYGPTDGSWWATIYIYGTAHTYEYLSPGTAYYWRVYTVTSYGIGSPSDKFYFTSGSGVAGTQNLPPEDAGWRVGISP